MIRRSASCASGESDCNSSSLEDYDVVEQIGQGGASIVYLASCRRGRLRNRHVALKKVPLTSSSSTSSALPYLSSSEPLHRSLHHPTVVSLFSTFSTPYAHYHVLELCSRGALSAFVQGRDPKILSEGELRGVAKSLVDALIYLRKELVIHRDIKPANILLTKDYRIKLSDFGLATRLPSVNSTSSVFCGSPNYVSPEIVSHLPYSFTTDLWSLGCLMMTCLSGTPPFEADEVSAIFENVSRAAYTLPDCISYEARDFIFSLLQVDPTRRIHLSRILSHPFFSPTLPVISLGDTRPVGKENIFNDLISVRQASQKVPPRMSLLPLKSIYPRRRGRHSDASPQFKGRKMVLRDIGNADLKNLLRDENFVSNLIPRVTESARRVVSEPLPRPPRSPTVELEATTSEHSSTTTPSLVAERDSQVSSISPHEAESQRGHSRFPCFYQSPPPNSALSQNTRVLGRQRSTSPLICPLDVGDLKKHTFLHQGNGYESALPVAIPVGTTRPSHFTTFPLNPQTLKTIHGQVTILPSHSLLVDLREGERRKGKKGVEVFVVNSAGTEIKVYSAPHLSTPCCLAEPTGTYPMRDLPPVYWTQYNEAGRLIEQIKQKTPRLVMYSSDSKCTLMANAPQADIEVLFKSSLTHQRLGSKKTNTESPRMRVRLSRQRHSVDIARYRSGSQGGEWTKKEIAFMNGNIVLSDPDWRKLEDEEREGVSQLVKFLRTCEAVEKLDEQDSISAPFDNFAGALPVLGHKFHRKRNGTTQSVLDTKLETKNVTSPASTVVKTLCSVNLAPRPSKLSAAPSLSQQYEGIIGRKGGNKPANVLLPTGLSSARHETVSVGLAEATPTCCRDAVELTADVHGFQTRFIPTVGWCIRYGSRVSQGGRYRIMFLDGVALVIDVDEEWVEFTGQAGDVTTHDIHDCISKRKIGERMKVFKEFVSMFEDDQE